MLNTNRTETESQAALFPLQTKFNKFCIVFNLLIHEIKQSLIYSTVTESQILVVDSDLYRKVLFTMFIKYFGANIMTDISRNKALKILT